MSRKKTQKDYAVDEAKRVAKLRDNYTCQKCNRSKKMGYQMHGAHIIPVEYDGTAADPENILCLCATCHSVGRTSAHEDPVKFGRWFDEMYPGLYDRMWQRAWEYIKNPFPKKDWKRIRQQLKEVLKQMGEEQ